MKIKIYQVDAFTDKVFGGNPAAVCPLERWLADEQLQQIAMENNLAETAFYVKEDELYQIRWFTPTVEVDLCGHATLASAFVLFELGGHPEGVINFYSSRSGALQVTKNADMLTLNFPADQFKPEVLSNKMSQCFNIMPKKVLKGRTDYLFVFETEDQVRNLVPDLSLISKLQARGVIVTAKGKEVDFVSRFFAPQSGIDEDPVTGSAHTTLAPYWSKELGKNELRAKQLSKREGALWCKDLGGRVEISGQACLYLSGEIKIG
jgi:PhzF family phenazine biosynthesis protein